MTSDYLKHSCIANELLTNAVKHGRGRKIVGLDTDPEKGYALSVSNEGPGLPDQFDPAACVGLGMLIIRSLVKKISGDFRFGRGADNQGARFVVRFSRPLFGLCEFRQGQSDRPALRWAR